MIFNHLLSNITLMSKIGRTQVNSQFLCEKVECPVNTIYSKERKPLCQKLTEAGYSLMTNFSRVGQDMSYYGP